MKTLLPISIVCLLFFFQSSTANAGVIGQTFRLDADTGNVLRSNQTIAGAQFTVLESGLASDGVSFDALLTVLGSGNLNQLTTGLGVTGGSTLVDMGESLRFSVMLQNIVGGSVTFEGFTSIDTNNATTSGDRLVFSEDDDLGTTADNFLTVVQPNIVSISQSPTVFSLFADSNASNSFRADSVELQFTTTPVTIAAVPEPSTLSGFFAVCLIGGLGRRRRSVPSGK